MNRFLITIFAFLLTLSSAFCENTPVLEVDFASEESLSSMPTWNTDNFIVSSSKKSNEVQVITTDLETLHIAPIDLESYQDHIFYLPIYNLVRQKEYFLLI